MSSNLDRTQRQERGPLWLAIVGHGLLMLGAMALSAFGFWLEVWGSEHFWPHPGNWSLLLLALCLLEAFAFPSLVGYWLAKQWRSHA